MLLFFQVAGLGKAYTEELRAANTGTINEYVRVTLYKYWVDADGNKQLDLNPAYINLNLVNLDTDWILDADASTTERTVLYFNRLLNSGDVTPMFTDTLTINGNVAAKAHQKTLPNGNIQTIYEYDGAQFCIEARVDAVQENNAEDAVLSAWGQNVIVDPDAGTLNLR